jgi:hypothetical protein
VVQEVALHHADEAPRAEGHVLRSKLLELGPAEEGLALAAVALRAGIRGTEEPHHGLVGVGVEGVHRQVRVLPILPEALLGRELELLLVPKGLPLLRRLEAPRLEVPVPAGLRDTRGLQQRVVVVSEVGFKPTDSLYSRVLGEVVNFATRLHGAMVRCD